LLRKVFGEQLVQPGLRQVINDCGARPYPLLLGVAFGVRRETVFVAELVSTSAYLLHAFTELFSARAGGFGRSLARASVGFEHALLVCLEGLAGLVDGGCYASKVASHCAGGAAAVLRSAVDLIAQLEHAFA